MRRAPRWVLAGAVLSLCAVSVLSAQQVGSASPITAEQLWAQSIKLLIGHAIVGILVLVAFVAIGKRFLDREFPAEMQRVAQSQERTETKIGHLDSAVRSIERDVVLIKERVASIRDHSDAIQGDLSRRIDHLERKVFRD